MQNTTAAVKYKSWLFTPATHPARFKKAEEVHAGVLIIDLEDAVLPQEREQARNNIINFMRDTSVTTPKAVRINEIESAEFYKDIKMLEDIHLSGSDFDFIVLPKVTSRNEIDKVNSVLKNSAITSMLIPMIENAPGVESAAEIAQSSKSVYALMFGAADFTSSINAEITAPIVNYVQYRMLLACYAAGINTIASPFFILNNPDELQQEALFEKHNGFMGKAAIHPAQIDIINRAFSPSEQEIKWANDVIKTLTTGAAVLNNAMIDEAMTRKARGILDSSIN
ncbi:TPA: CoA ester lyase [Serratia marcescens]|nr:CoA ester lyase [Serratia marcescens]